MIEDNEKLAVYLNTKVNSIFKILPLFEENNSGILLYVHSLHFELCGLEETVKLEDSSEYLELLSTLKSIEKEIGKISCEKKIIKREVFKCINITKNMLGKLEEQVES